MGPNVTTIATPARSGTAAAARIALTAALSGCTSATTMSASPDSSTPSSAPAATAISTPTPAPDADVTTIDTLMSQHASTENPGTVKEQSMAAYRAQNAAMLAANTTRLNELLDDHYVAVHIGGYQQPKQEWLEQVRVGQMAYHAITEQTASVTTQGNHEMLDATALVDATIFGTRATWRIRSTTSYTHTNGQWKATKSTATTY